MEEMITKTSRISLRRMDACMDMKYQRALTLSTSFTFRHHQINFEFPHIPTGRTEALKSIVC